jgi:hypothetical protein
VYSENYTIHIIYTFYEQSAEVLDVKAGGIHINYCALVVNHIKWHKSMKSTVLWIVTTCRSENARRFGGTYRLIQGPRVIQVRRQQTQLVS